MTVKRLVVVVMFLSGFGLGGSQLTWNQFVDLVQKLPVSDQYGFVQKNYLRGYDIAHYAKPTEIEHLDPASKLSLDVYLVIAKDKTRNQEEDRRRLKNGTQICFPDPIGCIDLDDGGLRPFAAT